ncbi:MAG: MgtC/SapB family protein [Planctomycetota bacterium]|nr:MAG: MgtC/SapB family protein [Planctomycetota bacterium]
MAPENEVRQLLYLGVALAIGLLVGTERGWQARDAKEGTRVAGIRTFGVLGLLGGVCALLAQSLGPFFLGLAFLAVALFLLGTYVLYSRRTGDVGATTETAALLTFGLGALAGGGSLSLASAAAVVLTFLLRLKPELHRWVRNLDARELLVALQLLLVLVVLLPVLPDRGYGPYEAVNPYQITWMVGLILAISFAAFVAMRLAGPRAGLLLTGLLGGLISSTAVTVGLARRVREHPGLERVHAAAIIAASCMMFLRVLLQVALVNRALLRHLLVPLLAAATAGALAALLLWRTAQRDKARDGSQPMHSPVGLGAAFRFSLLLAGIGLAARALHATFGDSGIYAASALSGLADVDAVTLSLARMAGGSLEPGVAAHGILLASGVNTLVKAVLAWWIGGKLLGRVAAAPLLLMLAAAAAVLPARILVPSGSLQSTGGGD